MGKEKDDSELMLVDSQYGPLPEGEYQLLHEPDFLSPFESIKTVVKEEFSIKEFQIKGLRTKEEALKEKFFNQKNLFCVNVMFQQDNLPDARFVLNGRTTVGALSDLIYTQFELPPGVGIRISFDNQAIPHDTQLLKLYKQSVSSNAALDLFCTLVDGEDVQ